MGITTWDDQAQAIRRGLRPQQGPQGRCLTVDGREVLNFCSNDYLGLAADPRLIEAATQAMAEEGFGSGASRLVCGNMPAHQRLESTLARFKGTEACVIFGSGYMANVGIISALFGPKDIVFSDRLNHASIIDGILLSRATLKRYAHRDMTALERLVRAHRQGRRRAVIVTDSVFSMDGDLAPLEELTALARRYDCAVMIDEAHALGVLGRHGRGAAEHFGVEKAIDIHMGTLSKAAGAYGAYCCGSRALIDALVNRARSLIYTTGLPPAVAAAAARAVEIIRDDEALRQRLSRNTALARQRIQAMGFDIGGSETPIIPLLVGDAAKACEFSRRLWEKGVWIKAICAPTVPVGTERLRLTVTAAHRPEDLERLLEVLEETGRSLCLI